MFPSDVPTVPTVPTFFLKRTGGNYGVVRNAPRKEPCRNGGYVWGVSGDQHRQIGRYGRYGRYKPVFSEGRRCTYLVYLPFLQNLAK